MKEQNKIFRFIKEITLGAMILTILILIFYGIYNILQDKLIYLCAGAAFLTISWSIGSMFYYFMEKSNETK